jgi:hypothetical protein
VPKANLHPLYADIQGTLFEDLVLKRSPSGKIIVSKKPDMSKVKKSQAQLENQERFKQASDYARAAKADPQVWAHYQEQAQRLKKRPRDLAMSDYYKGKNVLEKNPPDKSSGS